MPKFLVQLIDREANTVLGGEFTESVPDSETAIALVVLTSTELKEVLSAWCEGSGDMANLRVRSVEV